MIDVRSLFPRGSKTFYEINDQREVSHPVPKPDKTPALDGAGEGKTEGVGRTIVSFTGFRVRPLDPDNFAGSCKDLLDGIVHAGLVFDDTPWLIILRTEQEKVKTYAEEQTIIEIEW